MQRINFTNLPNQTTPVNATNLNQLQTNVENEFNGILDNAKFQTYTTQLTPTDDIKDIVSDIFSQIPETGKIYSINCKYQGGGSSFSFIGRKTSNTSGYAIIFGQETPTRGIRYARLNSGVVTVIDRTNTYSTSEICVGYWTNGKPIYRKVISFMPSTKTSAVLHNIQNIGKILPMSSAGFDRTGNQWMPMSFSYVTSSNAAQPKWNASYVITRTTCQVYMGDDAFDSIDTSKDGVTFVIYYTKSTD